jgi:hypothetical protein
LKAQGRALAHRGGTIRQAVRRVLREEFRVGDRSEWPSWELDYTSGLRKNLTADFSEPDRHRMMHMYDLDEGLV